MKGFTLMVLLAFSLTAFSQQIDIGLFLSNPNTLEVRLKPHGHFNGLVSNVAFSLRWHTNSNNHLGNIEQDISTGACIPMIKSGEIREAGGYNYQVFAGFGMNALSNSNQHWPMNEEIVLMTIPVTGNIEDFEIVNDSWTENVRNNGSFYTSLNGENRTGIIYQSKVSEITGLDNPETLGLKIYPNPTSNSAILEAQFTEAGDYKIELINTAGQQIFQQELKDFIGDYQKIISFKKLPSGTYILQVKGEDIFLRREIVKQ